MPHASCRPIRKATFLTRSKDGKLAYAICKQWPGKSLTLKGVRAAEGSKITMLGIAEPLAWQQNEQGLTIAIPAALQDEKTRPCQHAWAIRIPMQPRVAIGRKRTGSLVTLDARGIFDRVVYTLDCTEPTAQSTVYTGPITLTLGMAAVVKASCVRDGKLAGQTAFAAFQPSAPALPKPDIYLDTLEPVSFKTGWQAPGVKTWRNVNCHGNPLMVGEDVFPRGVGMHAKGEAVFSVKPHYRRFVCRAAIDDAAAGAGSVVVKAFLDGKLLCQTPVLTGKDGFGNIDAKLDGAMEKSLLRIVIEDNGDGIYGDNVNLVDAGFVVQH